MKKIIQNAARCLSCDTIIVSTHTHDMRYCSCRAIAVDGGKDYLKRNGDVTLTEDLNLFDDTDPDEIHQKLLWGTRGKDGTNEIEFRFVSKLETDHLEAILRTQQHAAAYIKDAIAKEIIIRRSRKIDSVLE